MKPHAVHPDSPEIAARDEPRVREHSLAILNALLPAECLQLLALSLEALRKEEADGGLEASFNTHGGRVVSADVSRRVHWRLRRHS